MYARDAFRDTVVGVQTFQSTVREVLTRLATIEAITNLAAQNVL